MIIDDRLSILTTIEEDAFAAFVIVMFAAFVMTDVAFFVRIASTVARPPMFTTIARIDDAFGARLRETTTMTTRIAFRWAFEAERAMMTERANLFDASFAVIFTQGDQRAMIVMASRFDYADAFLARSSVTMFGVARIGDASKLRTRASIARAMMTFGQTTFADTARIGTAEGFTAFAFDAGTTTSLVFFPSVFASFRRSRQSESRASANSSTTTIAIFQSFEIVLFAAAAGIIELNALTARSVVAPTTFVIMTTPVFHAFTTTTAIVVPASSVRRIQHKESGQSQENDDDRFGRRHFFDF